MANTNVALVFPVVIDVITDICDYMPFARRKRFMTFLSTTSHEPQSPADLKTCSRFKVIFPIREVADKGVTEIYYK